MASDHPYVRVFLRPIGTPMTIGLSGLAIASLVQSGLDLGWIDKTESRHVGLVLITVPFVTQLVASVFAYLARDGAAGAALGILSTTWLGMGVLHLSAAPGARSGALGLLLVAAGGTLACSSLGVSVGKPLLGTVFLLAAARFVLSGVHELGAGHAWLQAAGVLGCVITGLAGYSVLAFELEGQTHEPKLPTFRRSAARVAITGDLDAQAEGVVNEAGVRQMS